MNSDAVSSLTTPASTATAIASLLAFDSSVGMVTVENHFVLHARLNAPDVAVMMSFLKPSKSRSREAAGKNSPSSMVPIRIRPISIGLIPSLANMMPRSPEIFSPCFTTVTVC